MKNLLFPEENALFAPNKWTLDKILELLVCAQTLNCNTMWNLMIFLLKSGENLATLEGFFTVLPLGQKSFR